MVNEEMQLKISSAPGFIAALDQSGGSTPKALALYGISQDDYQNDEQMFEAVHQMRERIVTCPCFTGEKIIGAILFEDTLNRKFSGLPAAQYLWQEKNIVAFLKVDQGLNSQSKGVQLMKPINQLSELLDKASSSGVFGTKMRSVIKLADPHGIRLLVAQQFEIAKQIINAGLTPIIEPEIDINSPEKSTCEKLLKAELLSQLDQLKESQKVMLKLTLPDSANFYQECIEHNSVLKVVALSGGYSRELANNKLAHNPGVVASFSRALTQGLSLQQSEQEFSQTLFNSIDSIFNASSS